jgi:GAF domain-containing protein
VSESDKLRRQVATLATFGGHALRSGEIGELLQEATQLVSNAIGVDLVKVLQLLPDGQNLLVRAGVNWHPRCSGSCDHFDRRRFGSRTFAVRTKAPVVSDVATEKRFHTPRLLIEHGVRSTVNVVIRGEGAPFCVLEVDSREDGPVGRDDIDFLRNYANLLASAIDRIDKQHDLANGVKKQEILLHELQHRVNNMLMTIRAVA